MFCAHCGASLSPADVYCTQCGKPRAAAQPAAVVAPAQPGVPLPPNLHWALLIFLNLITCGIFGIVWVFIQASWARKLVPGNPAIAFVSAYAGGIVLAVLLSVDRSTEAFGTIVNIAGAVCLIIGNFKIRAAMEEYYNSVENIGLTLSGVMTFFFGMLYFQYHINRIANWQRTGVLT